MSELLREGIIGTHQSELYLPDKVEYYKAMFREHVELARASDSGVEIITEELTKELV